MKIGIKRHLKRVGLSLFYMGYYDPEFDDIQPGDIYILDTADTRNPFIDSPDEKVEILEVKQGHILFKHLIGGEIVGRDSFSKAEFLKRYSREK